MKSFQLCLLFVAIFATGYAMNSSWGVRNTTDVLLLTESVIRFPMANNYISADVVFPKSGQGNTRVISAIYVYDRFTNGTGATANLWSGGPGYTFTTLNLKSQFARGINSTVEIFGKK